jgi:hypothetical protein
MDEAIVDKVAARLLARMSGRPIDTGRREVFVVFTGAVSGFAAGREAVGRLVRSHHTLTILMTPSAKHIFGEGPLRQVGAAAIVDLQPWTDVSDFTRRADIVLVPTLTMNTAARLALGLMDSPATTLVLGALLAGKTVLAVRDGADPAGKRGEALGARPDGSPALWSLLADRLTTLESFGVRLTSKADFLFALEQALITPPGLGPSGPSAAATPSASSPRAVDGLPSIVTASDLMACEPGAVVRLGPTRRLTPQAADLAVKLRLKLDRA